MPFLRGRRAQKGLPMALSMADIQRLSTFEPLRELQEEDDASDLSPSATSLVQTRAHVSTLLDRTSWERLPMHMRELMDETMSFMEEEAARHMEKRGDHTLARRMAGTSAGGRGGGVDGVGGTALAAGPVQPPHFQQPVNAPAAVAFGHGTGQPVDQLPPQPGRRATLDAATVVQIYLTKNLNQHSGSSVCRRLAQQYGVTEKTVRDIWLARTWKAVTEPYRNGNEAAGGRLISSSGTEGGATNWGASGRGV